jgi:5-methyltetrahydrofolate--homocysteine methyltransferase
MTTKKYILNTIKTRPMIIDGAMGTQLQQRDEKIPKEAWECNEGCNELLNTCPEVLSEIYPPILQQAQTLLQQTHSVHFLGF